MRTTATRTSAPGIDKALALGVGGFILFGGDAERVRALAKELRQKSRVPLLIAADLERGAGQQFAGSTGLPPLSAIASLGDVDAVRRAARLTAREARTLGLNWDLAPVCDLDVVPENPIVGTRSLGSDSRKVAMLAQAWIQACQAEGVLACAKHFPGHGRTRTDSHSGLPVVDATRAELMEHDLAPFRAAIEAGVAGVMTAHVSYPALDASGAPATMSREMLQWLLRQQMRFEGLIVTDAMIMEGAIAEHGDEEAAIRALDAGCDLLLYPKDLEAVASAIDRAVATHRLDSGRIQASLRRRLKWAQWSSPANEYRRPSGTDVLWGAQLADRVIHVVHGSPAAMNGAARYRDRRRRSRRPVSTALARAAARFALRRRMEGAPARQVRSHIEERLGGRALRGDARVEGSRGLQRRGDRRRARGVRGAAQRDGHSVRSSAARDAAELRPMRRERVGRGSGDAERRRPLDHARALACAQSTGRLSRST